MIFTVCGCYQWSWLGPFLAAFDTLVCVLPVLWMTTSLHEMARNSRREKACIFKVTQHRAEVSDMATNT